MKYEYGNQFCVLTLPRPNSCRHLSGRFLFMISSMHSDASCFVMVLKLRCSDVPQYVAKRGSYVSTGIIQCACFVLSSGTIAILPLVSMSRTYSELARGRPNGSHCSVKYFFRLLADRDVPSLVHQLHPLTLDLTFQDHRVSCCHLVERKTSGNLLSIHCPVKLLFLRRAETHLPC